MLEPTELRDLRYESAAPPGQSERPWFLLALFLAVVACGAAVPITAVARGVVRFGAVYVGAGHERRAPLLDIGGTTTIEGTSDAPVLVLGGSLTLDGHAADDLIALPDAITIGPKAVAQGNAISLGGRISIAPTAVVSGSVIGSRMPWAEPSVERHDGVLTLVTERLRLAGLAIAALLLLGLAVWTVLPWPALVTTATARRCRVRSALLGVGTLAWAPLMVAPLALSLTGLPLAVLLVLGLGGLWLVGVVSSAVRLGHRLLSVSQRPHSMLTATLAGLVVLGLLPALPIVGPVALILAGCVGLGAALVALWDREAAGDLSVAQTLAALKIPE